MKKIFNIILVLASVALIPACHYEIDDVFDQPSAIRIQEEIARVDGILKGAQNGWLMEYYGATRYGGYNLLCKFNDDDTVLAQSEWYEDSATSHFKFEQSQGVVLSFDEYNKVIHFYSDPANPAGIGDNGDGMYGDFEFRVISASEEEVILKGKKHGATIIMKPMPTDLIWEEYLEDVLAVEDAMAAAAYVITAGDNSVIANASYRQLTFTDAETGLSINVPYMVTDKGFRLYRELTLNGKTAKEFVYSAEDEKCYAEDDNTFSIEVRITPLSEVITTGYWFFTQQYMSQTVLDTFMIAKEGSASESEVIYYMYLGTGDLFGPSYNAGWGFVFRSGGYVGTIKFGVTIVDDDTVTLAVTGADNNGTYYYNNCGYNQVAGLLTGTFDLATDNLKNPSYIQMTSTANPDVTMTTVPNPAAFPLGQ